MKSSSSMLAGNSFKMTLLTLKRFKYTLTPYSEIHTMDGDVKLLRTDITHLCIIPVV